MNIFEILGYTIIKPYSINSKTNNGQFAIITGSAPPPPPASTGNFFLLFG